MTPDRYVFKSLWKKRLAGFLDSAGGALLIFFKLFCPAPQTPDLPRKILLVRLDHVGDLLLTRPAVRLLRDYYPDAKIDWLVPAESLKLLGCDQFVDSLIPYKHHWYRRGRKTWETWREFGSLVRKLRAEHYDAALDFRGDFRSILLMFLAKIPRRMGYGITGGGFLLTDCLAYDRSLHQVELNAKLLQPLGLSRKPEYLPLHAQPELFSALVPRTSPEKKRVIVHPGAGYPSKVWPAENFERLLKSLTEIREAEFFIIGTREEKNAAPMSALLERHASVKDMRGLLELHDLPAFMQNAELFIGGDSGPAHIAAAQGIMVLSLFSGANDERLWRPWTPNLHLMTHKVPCSPCGQSVCPVPGHPCMEGILVEDVLHAARRLLEGKPV